ncbi:hypothetical protein HNQ34_000429 [Anoxybacillus tepidamans]|uniref:Spore coat protein n=1 Tax=Anoxybacteroides tepidamans TaxID=265948 RepID=A0A7W8MTD7_9BACL|nr:YppG family protein [Anoxybacillus tepidamans]MBB5323352.1 hypothetical protein [Anoxybacillus tepidamans]
MYRYPYPYRVSFPPPFSHSPHYGGWNPHLYHQAYSYWPVGQYTGASYPTPYPKSNPMLKPPTPAIQSLMSQFKNSDGTYDINKMMNTMGQMINTINQANGVLKGLISTFKK